MSSRIVSFSSATLFMRLLGTDGELHLEGRAFSESGLHPDAAAVHLDDLLGDREAEAGAAFRLGVRVVHLMEVLEDARSVLLRNTGTGVGDSHGEVTVRGGGADADFAGVGELDGISDEIEEDLRQTLLVAEAEGEWLCHICLERELLRLRQGLGGGP